MTVLQSAIYTGKLRHRRFTPIEHEFIYDITLFFMDLDDIDSLMASSRWYSSSKANLAQFRRSDFMAPHDMPLKAIAIKEVETNLHRTLHNPKVYLLSNLRLWGACFNPVSFYYVYEAESLVAIVAEVNNTPWNQRHRYVIQLGGQQSPYQTSFNKSFHVSPFNPMDMRYQWQCNRPGESLDVHMENWVEASKHMDATLTLQKKSWSSTHLNQVLLRTPFNSMKVPLSIYWQALKLWWKKAPFYNFSNSVTHNEYAEEAPRDERNSP